jgi:general secretion pathway protein M
MSPSFQRLSAGLLLLLVVIAISAMLTIPYLNTYKKYDHNLRNIQKRIEVYHNEVNIAGDQEQEYRLLVANNKRDTRYLRSNSESLGGAELQGIIKRVAKATGGVVFSTQLLPSSQENGFAKVSIRVKMKVTITSLVDALHALETKRPFLFVTEIMINAKRAGSQRRNKNIGNSRSEYRDLNVDFVLSGYMRELK